MSPELRARLDALTRCQGKKLFSALEATAARGIELDLDEQDFHTILDEITAPTRLKVLDALSPSELSALVRAQAFADVSQPVDTALGELLLGLRERRAAAALKMTSRVAHRALSKVEKQPAPTFARVQ